MADTRERLIELLAEFCPYKEKRCVGCDPGKHYHPECKTEQFGKVADHLIENGVTLDALIPPCKPWDKVWIICKTLDPVNGGFKKTICEGEIYKLSYNGFTTPMEWIDYRYDSPLVGQTTSHDRIDLCLGKTVFLTREEAEAALAERKMNDA